MRLEGKVALITGAAKGVKGELMGFGGASAWLFAQEGAQVVIADIDEETGQKTAAQMRESGHKVQFVRLDVTKEEDWRQAIDATVSHFSRLDVLVNNAGNIARANVEDTTLEMWQVTMDVPHRRVSGHAGGHPHDAEGWRRLDHQHIVDSGPGWQLFVDGVPRRQGRKPDLHQGSRRAVRRRGHQSQLRTSWFRTDAADRKRLRRSHSYQPSDRACPDDAAGPRRGGR